jgi:hypothetical protein
MGNGIRLPSFPSNMEFRKSPLQFLGAFVMIER